MQSPWILPALTAGLAALNLNARRSGEMMTHNPWVLVRRSKSPLWFGINLVLRWAVVAALLAFVAMTVMRPLLPHS